jgi:sulfate-transporting ATPase
LEKTIARELQWVRGGVRGQQTKSKARLDNYDKLQQERKARLQNKRSEGGALLIPEGPPLVEPTIIEVKGGWYWHDDLTEQQSILKDITLSIHRGDIVGIIGPNGTGKSTLLKLLVGDKEWKKGGQEVGRSVKLGYVNQSRVLNDESMVWQEIVGMKEMVTIDGDYAIPARAYVAQFNFSGADQSKRVGGLSGGERNRVNIAKSLNEGCNVIVLDEPTNDLDVDTLRALEDAIGDWGGAALIVSHDRWFLDRICNKLIVMEGEGEKQGGITVYEGGWSEYEEEQRKRKKGKTEEDRKFKKLSG